MLTNVLRRWAKKINAKPINRRKSSLSHYQRSTLFVEALETRQLLSGFTPTPVEQLALEELNDARANPAAYGNSIGLDLSSVAPSPPLAFDTRLIMAARQHSQDMNDFAYFGHISHDGLNPAQRVTAAGFVYSSWGESIAGGSPYLQPSDALARLIVDTDTPDLGHRVQLLALDAIHLSQNEIGIGIVQNGSGPLVNYYTIDTAAPINPTAFITGVVINDLNGNGKYDIGEGMGGVTITVAGVGSTTTFSTGGYSIAVSPGTYTYTVTASGGGLSAPITRQVVVGAQNVRLNFFGATGFIANLYQTVLGRAASTTEINNWLGYLQSGGSPSSLAGFFEHSPEIQGRLVTRWYAAYLGRQPAPFELQGWIIGMQRGMTEAQAQTLILGSDECLRHLGSLSTTGISNTTYVNSLYSLLLNRAPSTGEFNAWTAALAAIPRSAMAQAVIASLEYRSDVIAVYYNTILHRNASAAELTGWAISGLGFVDIRIDLESSPEFIQRS
jgi:uncharacterized protein YkwD